MMELHLEQDILVWQIFPSLVALLFDDVIELGYDLN